MSDITGTDSKVVKVKGLVVPTDWNPQGEIIGLGIQTDQEKEYFITMDKIGQDLIHLNKSLVVLTGSLVSKSEKTWINVSHFKQIKIF